MDPGNKIVHEQLSSFFWLVISNSFLGPLLDFSFFLAVQSIDILQVLEKHDVHGAKDRKRERMKEKQGFTAQALIHVERWILRVSLSLREGKWFIL